MSIGIKMPRNSMARYFWYKSRLRRLEQECLTIEARIRQKTEERDRVSAKVYELQEQFSNANIRLQRIIQEIGPLQETIEMQKRAISRREEKHPFLMKFSHSTVDKINELLEKREKNDLVPSFVLANTQQSENGQKRLGNADVIHCPSLKRDHIVIRFIRRNYFALGWMQEEPIENRTKLLT